MLSRYFFLKLCLIGICAGILTGCSAVKVQNYQNQTPELEIEQYFQGKTKAWGIFQDRFGTVRRRFTVDIHGTWDDQKQQLTLIEDFVYDDGEIEQRIWTITKTGEDQYTGKADGVIGQAIGKSAGKRLSLSISFQFTGEWKNLAGEL